MWSSLELVKVLVSALTPIAVLSLGVLVSRSARRIEDRQWVDRKVIERRLTLYDAMAPDLNKVLCFFATVGSFREITPPALIALKREMDQKFHTGKYLMSAEWRSSYYTFVEQTCFRSFRDVGTSALICADVGRQRRERGETWVDAWEHHFVTDPSHARSPDDVKSRYQALMSLFARDLGVPDVGGEESSEFSSSRPPAPPLSP